MVGKLIIPIVMTVAPTMPVEAASIPPTMTTDIAKPPLSLPNSIAIVSNSRSAKPDFSSIIPIKTNSGTAIKTKLLMVPKILSDSK